MSAASRAREKARGGMSHQDRNAADFGAHSRGLVVHHGEQLEKKLTAPKPRSGIAALFAGALLSVVEGLDGLEETTRRDDPMFGKQPTKLRPEEVRGAQILNPQAQKEDPFLPKGQCLKITWGNDREFFTIEKFGMTPNGAIFLNTAFSRPDIGGTTRHTALAIAGGYLSEIVEVPEWLSAILNQEQ